MLGPLDGLGTTWPIVDEVARPGYYAATLLIGTDSAGATGRSGDGVRHPVSSHGIRAELTVGPKSAVHRYTFPASGDARIVIDCSMGGLRIDHGATVPLRAHLEVPGPNAACAEIRVEGAPLTAYVECDAGDWRPTLWYDRPSRPRCTTR
jgi:putative alpha-1,2-mannosidase